MASDYNKKLDYSRFRPIGYPVRHRRKVPFYPMLSLGMDYRAIMAEIRELDRVLGGYVLGADDYLELVRDAYSDNIHWSTKVEGNNLSPDEVRRLTTRFTEGDRIEQSVGPVQEIVNHLHSSFADRAFGLPWDAGTASEIHRMLMSGVDPAIDPGVFRTGEVSVVGADGTGYFIACPASSIRVELESLMDWMNNSPYDELVTATAFFHEFESIHPFEDGNGRVGRTMFQMLLQGLGLRNCKLCRFERELLGDTATYYDLLAYVDSTGNYGPLVMFFAESLLTAYREAVEAFGAKDRLKDMDENGRKLVRFAKEADVFRLTDANAWLPGTGAQTVRARLDELVEMGILEKEGRTKGMAYRFKDPLRNLHYNEEIIGRGRSPAPAAHSIAILTLSAEPAAFRVTSSSPLLHSACAEDGSTLHGRATSFTSSLPGVLTVTVRVPSVPSISMSSFGTPGSSRTAFTSSPWRETSRTGSTAGRALRSMLPLFPNSFTCLTPSGPWYMVYP